MTIENPRAWTQPVSEYRGLDIVLTREQVGDAIASHVEGEPGYEAVKSIPTTAHCVLTISGDNVRCQFVWKDGQ